MPSEALSNLARIGKIKAEPMNRAEIDRMFDWPAHKWRVLDAAHQKRNLAEYEGFLEIEESTIAELQRLATELIADVEKLVSSS